MAARVRPNKLVTDPSYPPGKSASLGLPILHAALPCVFCLALLSLSPHTNLWVFSVFSLLLWPISIALRELCKLVIPGIF